ncbi:DNA polymerase [Saccharopolyspora lacisalsi]|uniref:Type-4 uracil-DNA glycosylase n=1 Tax=Halosaccharopolyspora lacisalsi TaxID=1000566 RepID=A0A839DW66_9PSEU|nr:UdgX family uracil-DNA binding protein [Halosaccharopolyspora lacisalsi]MBA8824476.1 DNA polymerase [Halosaccharopolyspora lacisalsi]
MAEEYQSAEPFLPSQGGIAALRKAAGSCRGCALHRDATQTVFGDGPAEARTVFVGEQPGDREDREGRPFVGPAGGLLDRALEEAGIDRDDAYLTNVVKHFKYTYRGNRRMHGKPGSSETKACWPWFAAELRAVRPELVVCLGATAAQTLLGKSFRVTADRGALLDFPPDLDIGGGPRPRYVLTTVHPSAVLRAGDDRDAAYRAFLDDLGAVAEAIE